MSIFEFIIFLALQTAGFTIVAEKLNFFRYLSHFRAVHRGAFFGQMRTTAVRKLLPEAWGEQGSSCLCVVFNTLLFVSQDFCVLSILLMDHLVVYSTICLLSVRWWSHDCHMTTVSDYIIHVLTAGHHFISWHCTCTQVACGTWHGPPLLPTTTITFTTGARCGPWWPDCGRGHCWHGRTDLCEVEDFESNAERKGMATAAVWSCHVILYLRRFLQHWR